MEVVQNANKDAPDLGQIPMASRTVELQFFNSSDQRYTEEKPFFSNVPFLQTGSSSSNVLMTPHPVQLFDVRGHERELDLDRNGFEVVSWAHGFQDLDASITRDAYPSVVQLLKRRLGDHVRVVVFDHTLRQSHAQAPKKQQQDGSAIGGSPTFGRPSNIAHSDQTRSGTIRQIEHDFDEDADEILKHRFRVINVWKPLRVPVEQRPLVLCDYRTSRGDEHPCDLVYPHIVSENLMFGFSPRQRWYHISDQRGDETWLIKIMDSSSQEDPNIAEHCAHTSCYDDHPSRANAIRQSVEFRAYVFG